MTAPHGRRRSRLRRAWGLVLGAAGLLALALLLDGLAWRHLVLPQVYGNDLGRLLRCMGFLGTWWLVALLWALVPAPAPRSRGALLLVAAPTLAVPLADLLKLVLRRERPGDLEALYHFRPWSEQPWSSSGLGLPSSHAAVAFAGATVLALLVPRWRWPLGLLAAGCALTRVLDRAHFLSDVVAGALVGVVLALWLHRCWGISAAGEGASPGRPAAGGPPSGPTG